MRIRDFLWAGRSSQGTWSCRREGGKSFLTTAFLCRHNHLEIGNYSLEGIHHTQTVGAGHNIVHECHLQTQRKQLPQALSIIHISI